MMNIRCKILLLYTHVVSKISSSRTAQKVKNIISMYANDNKEKHLKVLIMVRVVSSFRHGILLLSPLIY